MRPQGKEGRKGGPNGQPSQPNREWEILAGCLLKDKPSVAQALTHSSWLGFLPYARVPALGSNLTVRIEVVNPFILVASITCSSKHTLPRSLLLFHFRTKILSFVLSVQSQPY